MSPTNYIAFGFMLLSLINMMLSLIVEHKFENANEICSVFLWVNLVILVVSMCFYNLGRNAQELQKMLNEENLKDEEQ